MKINALLGKRMSLRLLPSALAPCSKSLRRAMTWTVGY